ncbi:MAG: OmpA family protein [Bacteroidetes bacterium]|nr:OmpA family protein [Bacteroidota bacterium]
MVFKGSILLHIAIILSLIATTSGQLLSQTSKAIIEVRGFVHSDDIRIPFAKVILSLENEVIDDLMTGQDGKFSFQLLRGKIYTIIGLKDGYTTNSVKINSAVVKGNRYTVILELPRNKSAHILGKVVFEGKSLNGTHVMAIYNDKVVDQSMTGKSGTFFYSLYPNESYRLKALKTGFYYKELNLLTPEKLVDDTSEIIIAMERIRMGETKIIDDVDYEFGKSELVKDASIALEKVAVFIKMNPGITVEIGAHTDSRSSAAFNLELSQKRAQAVVDALVSLGIERERLLPKGYGEAVPRVLNARTEDEHQKNRRTAFKVIKIEVSEADFNKAEPYLRGEKEQTGRASHFIRFYVQIGAGKQLLPLDHAVYKLEEVIIRRLETGGAKYMIGPYNSLSEANTGVLKMQNKGFGKAFVLAYNHSERISIKKAKKELGLR